MQDVHPVARSKRRFAPVLAGISENPAIHVEMHLSLCMLKIRWKEMVEYSQKRPGREMPLRKRL
jgi:hypothetical protein